MNQPDPKATAEEPHFHNAPTLTADELGLVIRTPKPEEALLDLEKHLREIGLYSGSSKSSE